MGQASRQVHNDRIIRTRTITVVRLVLAVALAAAGTIGSIAPAAAASSVRSSAAATTTRASSAPAPARSGAKAFGPSVTADRLAGSGVARSILLRTSGPAIGGPLSPTMCGSTWNIVSSPNGTGDNFLDATAGTSASDVWAVGNQTSNGFDRTLIEHWNGSSWSIVPSGNVGTNHNDLNGVMAFAPNNAWAVGTYIDHVPSGTTFLDIPQNLIMHWNGTSWSTLPSVDAAAAGFSEVSNVLLGVAGAATNDIWAIGEYYDAALTTPAWQTLALHYDGTSWTVQNPANNLLGDNALFGISARTTSDVWASGYYRASNSPTVTARQTLTEHWNGTSWSVVASLSVNTGGDSNLYGISAVSATSVWAVGYGRTSNTSLRQTLIEHYDGTVWSIVTSPNVGMGDNVLYGLSLLGTSAGWAVGYSRSDAANTNPPQTLALHYDGTNWSVVTSADNGSAENVVFALTALSASDVWAAGWYANGLGVFQTLTENFCMPPIVTGISPTAGVTSGGTTVTITGTGLVLATAVNFGSVAAASFVINSDTQITAVSPPQTSGQVDVMVSYFGGSSATSASDKYTVIPLYVFSPQPIATSGTLAANANVNVTLSAKNFVGTGVSGASAYLSFVQSGGSETAKVGATLLNAVPTAFTADGSGNIAITYSTGPTPGSIGTDTITAQDTASSPTETARDTYTFSKSTTFYFAEGFTGTGFTESLSLLMPTSSGTATIDYYTEQGHQPTITRNLTAGTVFVEDVNGDLGAGHQVSAVVQLPARGIVERQLHFNNGPWRGSNDNVGVGDTAPEWDFAEGSTLSIFAEYLSVQNPNPYPVVVDLKYATDIGKHPVKTLILQANSRITIVVGLGDTNDNSNCSALTTCGVGGGVTGVSVQVKSRTLPIVAERPFYVNNYSFGYGAIRDGHDAFGANAPSTKWSFAEGTTLNGFNEYLTIQNPGTTVANVTLNYIDDIGAKVVHVAVNPQSRTTALVFDANNLGVGRGYVGVSVTITADQPIVAERPMYIYFNFGTGPVAGTHVVVGAPDDTVGTLYGFAAASTATGENDYLTIQNTNAAIAHITVDYYTTGGKVTKAFTVSATSRHTVLVFANNGEGIGTIQPVMGIVVTSDQNVLVEKPTYSSTTATYGATDTTGYSPPGGF